MDPVILTMAFLTGYLVYRLGLPPLVGFLPAGLGLSAFGFTSTPLLRAGSDVGVTLLLFTIIQLFSLCSLCLRGEKRVFAALWNK